MQKWYSSYLSILKTAHSIDDSVSEEIYSLAFHKLVEYGLGIAVEDGEIVIQDGNDSFRLNATTQQDELFVVEEEKDESNSQQYQTESVSVDQNPIHQVDLSSVVEDFNELFPKVDEVEESPSTVGCESRSLPEQNLEEDDDEEIVIDNPQEVSGDVEVDEQGGFIEDDIPDGINEGDFSSPFDDEANPFGSGPSFVVPEINPFDSPDDSDQMVVGIPSVLDEQEASNFNASPFEEAEDPFTSSVAAQEELEVVSPGDVELEVRPEDLPMPDMPLTLEVQNFTFDIRTVKSKDLEEQAAFIIAPLRLDLSLSTAVVQAKINGGTYISTTDSEGHLEFESNRCRYVIDCGMKNGKFSSIITLEDCDVSEFDISSRSFGDKGHIVLPDEEEGIFIHIIPVSFKSNPYGYADFIYCIDQGNGEFFAESNHGEKSALVDINDETYEIMAKWQDKTLYAKIDTPEE